MIPPGASNNKNADLGLDGVFGQLSEFKWRGVPFPCSTFKVAMRHNLARHRYVDTDGENVEPTGREALVFTAHIPFRNGISPGKKESWGDRVQVLYPFGYRKFLAACQNRAKGDLVHPEMGTIPCYVESCETTTDGTRRDGVDVDVTWIETTETFRDLTKFFDVRWGLAAGLDLDNALSTSLTVPATPEFEPNFADTMRGFQGIVDQAFLAQNKALGRLNAVLYRLDNIQAAVSRLRNALDWPFHQAIERLRGAVNDLKSQLNVSTRAILFYVVPKDTTLAALAASTGAKLGDLVLLNPKAVATPIITAKTRIRYYAAA